MKYKHAKFACFTSRPGAKAEKKQRSHTMRRLSPEKPLERLQTQATMLLAGITLNP